jgi:antitoxin ParD1/3/4
MDVSLTPELEKVVRKWVSSGIYRTADEVIREGLRLLIERDRQAETLRRDTRVGFDAVGRGEYPDYDANTIHKLADRVKSRGRKRLTAERAKSSAK